MLKYQLLMIVLSLFSCQGRQNDLKESSFKSDSQHVDQALSSYWYQGKAELNHYELSQSRYGETHPGHAVIVFVSEDFSTAKQVKLDNPGSSQAGAQGVLKCNFIKKFYTGLYPYSMIMSVFSPVGKNVYPHPLKMNSSIQEWCGHVFIQMNRVNNQYKLQSFSYFESESDQQILIPVIWSEDEIWNQIRIDPKRLPVGTFEMIPGMFYTRLAHEKVQPVQAKGDLREIENENWEYTLRMNEDRTLSIQFKKETPFTIQSWSEEFNDFGKKSKTVATLKKQILSDYWNKHKLEDSVLRKEFLLP
ncbi:MAG: hypothetical protein M3Q56_05790 [Bacteroidota bacterium]|nr:hypothetical protein [Bacteroidota bacterium]